MNLNGGKIGRVGVVSRRGLLPGAFIKLTLLSRQYNHPDMVYHSSGTYVVHKFNNKVHFSLRYFGIFSLPTVAGKMLIAVC